MKKIIRLTESDLARIVRRVLNEGGPYQDQDEFNETNRLSKSSKEDPGIMYMFTNKEVSGTWYYDSNNKRLCIEAKTRRSFCYSDSHQQLSSFDSTKFKPGEKGNFTITSSDGGATANLIIK